MTKSTVGQTLVQLSKSSFDCFRVWWLRWTSGEDGCWFSGSHCFSSEQGLKTASNQIVKLFQPQISEGDSARWACSGVWDDRSWCQPRASNQHHNQAASKQGFSSKSKSHLPPNHLQSSTSPDSNSQLHMCTLIQSFIGCGSLSRLGPQWLLDNSTTQRAFYVSMFFKMVMQTFNWMKCHIFFLEHWMRIPLQALPKIEE